MFRITVVDSVISTSLPMMKYIPDLTTTFILLRRVILKMAFVREVALMSDEMRNHVSHHNANGSAGKKNKKDRKKNKKR